MTPWSWWWLEEDDDPQGGWQGDCKDRASVIAEVQRELPAGARFTIMEARSSTAIKHEGSECVPFLRTRNRETLTNGPRPRPISRKDHAMTQQKGDLARALFSRLTEDAATQLARDMAGHVGDEVHRVIKRHATMMPTVSLAAAVGVLAARQILEEAITFARKSMDDDADDEAAMEAALRKLFNEVRP